MNNIYITAIFVIAIFGFFSCNNFNNKEYYSDGSIKLEYNLIDNKIDGICKEYYFSTGELKSITEYRLGVIDGFRKSFYKNGVIKSIENYSHNKLNGDCLYYNTTGGIDSIKNYILTNSDLLKIKSDGYSKFIDDFFSNNQLGKTSQLNSVLRINNNGMVDLKKSRYFEIVLKKDTINLGDSLYAYLSFKYRSNGEKTKYIVYQFIGNNFQSLNIYETNNDFVRLKDKPVQKKGGYLCGYIEEYTAFGCDTLKHILFFKKKYYVK